MVGKDEGRHRGGAGPGIERSSSGGNLRRRKGKTGARPSPPGDLSSTRPPTRAVVGELASHLGASSGRCGGLPASGAGRVVLVEEQAGRWRGAARGPWKWGGMNAFLSAGKLAGLVG